MVNLILVGKDNSRGSVIIAFSDTTGRKSDISLAIDYMQKQYPYYLFDSFQIFYPDMEISFDTVRKDT